MSGAKSVWAESVVALDKAREELAASWHKLEKMALQRKPRGYRAEMVKNALLTKKVQDLEVIELNLRRIAGINLVPT